jgi:hypothetical protein
MKACDEALQQSSSDVHHEEIIIVGAGQAGLISFPALVLAWHWWRFRRHLEPFRGITC